MKVTRLQTMASVLVTLAAPAAYGVVSHPMEEKFVKKHQSHEALSAWQIPAPSQTLGRVGSADPVRETFGALGAVKTVDPITQSPKARFGRLPLSLSAAFGGQKAHGKWLQSALKSEDARRSYGQHLEKHLRYFVAQQANELGVQGLKLNWDAQKFYVDAQHTFASFFVSEGETLVEGAELTFRFSEGQLINIMSKTFDVAETELTKFNAIPCQCFSPTFSTQRTSQPTCDNPLSAKTLFQSARPVLSVASNCSLRVYGFSNSKQKPASEKSTTRATIPDFNVT